MGAGGSASRPSSTAAAASRAVGAAVAAAGPGAAAVAFVKFRADASSGSGVARRRDDAYREQPARARRRDVLSFRSAGRRAWTAGGAAADAAHRPGPRTATSATAHRAALTMSRHLQGSGDTTI